jgi:hypothetical protein
MVVSSVRREWGGVNSPSEMLKIGLLNKPDTHARTPNANPPTPGTWRGRVAAKKKGFLNLTRPFASRASELFAGHLQAPRNGNHIDNRHGE